MAGIAAMLKYNEKLVGFPGSETGEDEPNFPTIWLTLSAKVVRVGVTPSLCVDAISERSDRIYTKVREEKLS